MVSVMLYPCIFCVVLLIDVLCVCELFLKQFAIFFGCGCYFVVDVMEVLSVGGCALLDRPCMVLQRMCDGNVGVGDGREVVLVSAGQSM